jgi:filamentous hemagglutinin family protein
MRPCRLALTAGWLLAQVALADVTPDAAASAMHRAVVGLAGNVPVVRIVAPDGSGLSHNKWSAFDAPAQGLVLNNATAGTRSALAGPVEANAGLGGNAARLILNEVTSNRPSALSGRIEVAGQSARLVIANPNGIACDGCGFINTPHVQLTTGRPEFAQGRLQFDVIGGAIELGRSGLTALAGRLDLIARTLRSAGPITTQAGLNVSAGRAVVDADTLAASDAGRVGAGPYPNDHAGGFAIDIGQSVSAGSIQLVAVGDQLGVRTTAALKADTDIFIASREHIELHGPIDAGRNAGIYNVGAWHSVIDDSIAAGNDLQIIAMDLFISGRGRLAAHGNIELGFMPDNSDSWTQFVNAGAIEAGGDVRLSHIRSGLNAGSIRAGVTLEAAAGGIMPMTAAIGLPGASSRRSVDDGEVALVNTGALVAGQDLFLNLVENDGGTVRAGRDAYVWQSLRGRTGDEYQASHGLDGRLDAGRDLFLFAPVESFSTAQAGVQSFIAQRNLYLLPPPDPFSDRQDMRDLPMHPDIGVAVSDYVNRDRLAAANDVFIALPASFENQSVVDAGRDIRVATTRLVNATRIVSRHETFSDEHFDGCRTTYKGVCSADIEAPAGSALMRAGRDLLADVPIFVNRGATMLAGRDIDVATHDFLNEDRRYRAVWSSTYYAVDPDAQFEGGACTGTCVTPIDWQRSSAGEVALGSLPGIMQAGRAFSSGAFPRLPPPAGPPAPSGGGVPGPAAPPPVVGTASPNPLQSLVVQMLGSGAGSIASGRQSRFINVGSIHAASIVIRADDIRNGFDFAADYHQRTAMPSLPPTRIDLAGLGSEVSPLSAAGGYSGTALMQILPPALARHEPFALMPSEEEAALRNAFLATSHRAWILPGLDWDPVTGQSPEQQQHAILVANGAAFAIEHGLPMGAALSADQQSQMTAPMLWYVETDGRLFPWVYLPDDWQGRLIAVPGGELGAAVAIALTGGRIDNTGFVLTDGALAVTAEELENRKRSAYYYERRKVSGGTLVIEGDTVQPGGLMQAARWDLNAGAVSSVSGEFRVVGESAESTAALSQEFEAQIATVLGDNFEREVARDNLHFRFHQSGGFGSLLGVVAGLSVSLLVGPEVSALVGSFATDFGATFAAATTGASAGLGNAIASAAVTQSLSSSASQLVSSGSIDFGNALTSGLAGGFTAGAGAWSSANLDDAFQRFSVRTLAAGAAGELTGSGFRSALLDAVINETAARGANEIGRGNFGQQGTLGHALAHGVLGALAARARGADAYSGAVGAITATLVEQPLDQALGLQDRNREIALTALSMLAGGAAADALGGDPLTAGRAAQNATVNNYLTRKQSSDREAALAACRTVTCRAGVYLRYAGISKMQDTGLLVGIGGGIGYQAYEQTEAIIGLVEHLPETLHALRSIVSDPEFRTKVGDAIAAGYGRRIDMLTNAYESGDWDGSITAGVEAGRLAVDVVTAGYVVAGAGKVLSELANAGLALSKEASTAIFESALTQAARNGVSEQAATSVDIAVFNPINPGPLANSIAITFRSATYTERNLPSDQILYRVISEYGDPTGSFWTSVEPHGALQSVIDFSLDQNWGNTATRVVKARIPAGTKIYEGVTAPERGLVGGGNQIYIPKVDVKWIVR